MMFNVKNVLYLTILTVLASTGNAIHCYIGDSVSNPKCGEKFDALACELLDCIRFLPPRYRSYYFHTPQATGCMKQTLEGVSGHQKIVRSCYFGDVNNKEGCQADTNLNETKCDVCTKDGCNGSAFLTPIAGAIILFFGVARLLV